MDLIEIEGNGRKVGRMCGICVKGWGTKGVWGECGVFGVKLRGLGGQLEGKQR